jgi:hypothetical protein
LPVSAGAPALFSKDTSGTGQGAILNQAGGIRRGQLGGAQNTYATGTGGMNPRSHDGIVSSLRAECGPAGFGDHRGVARGPADSGVGRRWPNHAVVPAGPSLAHCSGDGLRARRPRPTR